MPDELPAPIEGQALIYATADGTVRVEVLFGEETFWLTINRMSELFGTTKQTISYHLRQIYESGELSREATVKGILTVQREGSRDVARTLDYYDLDAVISVGYRVNSLQATQFRIWATHTVKEFMVKGFVLDDERLKQGARELALRDAVRVTGLHGQVRLHRRACDLEELRRDRILLLLAEPGEHLGETPDRRPALVDRRGRGRVAGEYELAHVLARDVEQRSHIGEPDKVG